MISTANLGMRYGGKVLFEKVSLRFDPGKMYGLVGANGAGKSTFLRLLSGEEQPSEGEINIPTEIKLGFLKQDHFRYENWKICDVVIAGNQTLHKALTEKETLLSKEKSSDGNRIAELEEIIAGEEGYRAEAEAGRLLAGLGISAQEMHYPLSSLSGGFKLRVLLAQLLFSKPDILLLDEPTNHLDIVSIRWLEMFLKDEFQGTVILISHDRDFLNRVCTHIADVDFLTITLYTGNYDSYLSARQLAVEQREREAENAQKKIDELQAFVDRFKAKASKARQAQSRVKQIEKIEIPDIVKSSRRHPRFEFKINRTSARETLVVKNLNKSFSDKQVLNKVNFTVERGEKIAIIGPNGAGKSTLLKILCKEISASAGNFQWGMESQISKFAQDHHEVIKGNTTVYDWLYDKHASLGIGPVRSVLGAMLFSQDEALKKLPALSGGEAARLMLADIILTKGNILLLDEPTNHLDLEALSSLETALQKYEGTILFVSHDRHFVNALSQRIFEITPEGFREFRGNYTEYLQEQGQDHLDRDISWKGNREKNSAAGGKSAHRDAKAKKREFSRLQKIIADSEKQIKISEEKIGEIDSFFANPDNKASLSPVDYAEKYEERQLAEKTLSQAMLTWEEAQRALEIFT